MERKNLSQVTVEGNAGPDIDRKVRRDLINMFHMEYDICRVGYYMFHLFFYFL